MQKEKKISVEQYHKNHTDAPVPDAVAAKLPDRSPGTVINLGIKQERAKEHPLIDYNVYFTDGYPCIMRHSGTGGSNVIIEARRSGDRLCICLCRECVETLLFALRTVNEKNIYYADNCNMTVKHYKYFTRGDFCYFCGFGDSECYDIRLNKIGVHMCSHCRERSIIQLKKLIRIMDGEK